MYNAIWDQGDKHNFEELITQKLQQRCNPTHTIDLVKLTQVWVRIIEYLIGLSHTN